MYKVTAIAGCFKGTYHRCTFSAPFWHPLRFDFFWFEPKGPSLCQPCIVKILLVIKIKYYMKIS